MSTYYSAYCKQCDSQDSTWARNDASVVVAIIKVAPIVRAANTMLEVWPGAFPAIGFDSNPCERGPDWSWFNEHAGHELFIRSEYGQVFRLPEMPFKYGDPPDELEVK